MSYQVIARKYRPQTFADLTGQEHITRTLSYALDHDRLHHAYLFSGVRGTGKTTSARILAKGLNCRKSVTSQPCLQCESCTEIAAGNSLSVMEIDAASNTGVDNVREVIINNIAITTRDRYKVFVIDEVHMLSNSAFNALLKTLEEPPPHVVFIMATTELHKVPDTILSRCQQFEFRHIPTEKIFQRLREIATAENVNITDEALREIARAGAGSLRDAQSALDQVIAFGGEKITEDDVINSLGLVGVKTLGDVAATIAAQDTASLLNLIEAVTARGYDLRNFTRELMSYWRHLLVVKSGITSSEILGVADVEIGRIETLAKQFSEADLVRCFHLLAETEKEIKDSPHPRYQLEIGLVKLAHATRLRTLDEIISRLNELESALTAGGSSLPVRPAASAAGKVEATRQTAEFTAKAPVRPAAEIRETPAAPAPLAEPRRTSAPTPAASALAAALDEFDLPDLPRVPALTPLPKAAPPESVAAAPVLPAPVLPKVVPPPAAPRNETPKAALQAKGISTAALDEPPGFADFDSAGFDPYADGPPEDDFLPPEPPRFSAKAPPRNPGLGQGTQAILDELQLRKQTLILMALEDARVSYQDGELTVAFASDDTMTRRVRDSGALFRDIGLKLFNQVIHLNVTVNGQAVSTEPVAQPTRQNAEQQAQFEQAKQIPAVQLLLDKFKGEIISVKAAD